MNIRETLKKQGTQQFLRYLVTGGAAFVLEYLLYLLLYKIWGVDYALAMVTVYSFLFFVTFVATRRWTFQSEGNVRRQLVLYLLLFLFNVLVGNYYMMRFLVGVGVPAEFAPFLKTAMVTAWNFLIYKYIIYV